MKNLIGLLFSKYKVYIKRDEKPLIIKNRIIKDIKNIPKNSEVFLDPEMVWFIKIDKRFSQKDELDAYIKWKIKNILGDVEFVYDVCDLKGDIFVLFTKMDWLSDDILNTGYMSSILIPIINEYIEFNTRICIVTKGSISHIIGIDNSKILFTRNIFKGNFELKEREIIETAISYNFSSYNTIIFNDFEIKKRLMGLIYGKT